MKEELGAIQMGRVFLNLAEILKSYLGKIEHFGADYPPLRMIEGCLAQSGVTEDRIMLELEKFTTRTPDFAEAWLELGYACLDRENYPKAIACFDNSLTAINSLPMLEQGARCGALAAFGKATVLEAQGYFQAAAEAYGKGFELMPGASLMHIRYARILRRLGRLNEALAQFDAGMDTDVTPYALMKMPRSFETTAMELSERFRID